MRGHRQVSRYVACWTGRLCCHSSSVYVIIYLWELINYTTTIMARSSQFAWFYYRVLFFSSVSAVCFLPASSQFRLAASIREVPKQTKVGCLITCWLKGLKKNHRFVMGLLTICPKGSVAQNKLKIKSISKCIVFCIFAGPTCELARLSLGCARNQSGPRGA